jgi:hypothetical protein
MVTGMPELKKLIEDMGKVPATVLTKAAKAGAKIAYDYSRNKIQANDFGYDTGIMKKSIKLVAERRKTGKCVYDVKADYPANLIDYGFSVKGKYVPGNRFLRDGVDRNREAIQSAILEAIGAALDGYMGSK